MSTVPRWSAPGWPSRAVAADYLSEYEALLVPLHELARAGQDDGPDVDALREQMDEVWLRMSSDERERAGLTSAKLAEATE